MLISYLEDEAPSRELTLIIYAIASGSDARQRR